MRLPHGKQADLGNKIEDYCLSTNHDKFSFECFLRQSLPIYLLIEKQFFKKYN
ncbi:MAG: hypothetical protein GW795_05260 [Cyanobacteria bacterium]|nr:hypothetical protein [Cyanobacteria bacterium CG_2015-16_32_12]NCO79236.1 hypothetical protein [Cyanobacteria bacterium CG_2015-22_32_23]NCQ04482.1 hypothetical protein [Cyanobacteria bacterium CG_2015-09_32_10]NCQ41295.1 hypothetical protein [Cyanobacteria bacterium CG_2015-04_32_10]NCS84392.1 hypothetical protein [Cyanobacteria bacterium CG_2015-02_32_10]